MTETEKFPILSEAQRLDYAYPFKYIIGDHVMPRVTADGKVELVPATVAARSVVWNGDLPLAKYCLRLESGDMVIQFEDDIQKGRANW